MTKLSIWALTTKTPLEQEFNTRMGSGTPADCLRFANPAEADCRPEDWRVRPMFQMMWIVCVADFKLLLNPCFRRFERSALRTWSFYCTNVSDDSKGRRMARSRCWCLFKSCACRMVPQISRFCMRIYTVAGGWRNIEDFGIDSRGVLQRRFSFCTCGHIH